MKVLIVSDTHGRHAGIEEAIEREYPFQKLIHLGDAEGYEEYIAELAECPIEIVAGNNDFFSHEDKEKEIMLGNYRVLMTHGHLYGVSTGISRLASEGEARGAQVVLYGHTHRPAIDRWGNLTLMNPGSLSYPRQQGRKPSFGILEIDREEKIHFTINFLD